MLTIIACVCIQVKEPDVHEDDEVDVLTVERDSAFSDSDMSQEELCFLPAVPCLDVPEQQDKCVGSCSKLPDGNHSGSPLSVEAGQNGNVSNHNSSPLEGKFSFPHLLDSPTVKILPLYRLDCPVNSCNTVIRLYL